MSEAIKVLIVDDNDRYREAFARNLYLRGMIAIEAHHGDHAMELLKTETPDVMITDLQMRSETEGLDLIRDARAIMPAMPIIMISAVGSFDEGARASQLGAAHVLSKARIEEEIETLYECIDNSVATYQASCRVLDEIAEMRKNHNDTAGNSDQTLDNLRKIMADESVDTLVKSEAFDVMTLITDSQRQQDTGTNISSENNATIEGPEAVDREAIRENLASQITKFDAMNPDTQDSLLMAEYLYQQIETLGSELELSRSTCFSYCFSVENQAKMHLKKKLTHFLEDPQSLKLIKSLQEKKSSHVSMFFQQHLLQLIRGKKIDFTIDNVRQTFMRILEHKSKYRPDGLKALGIMILAFGRTYSFKQFTETVTVDNPMGLKGMESDDEMLRFAQSLINLQHLRNPYIHPEISGQAGIEQIRETAIQCLNLMMRIE